MTTSPPGLTIAQAAQRLGLDVATVRKRCQRGSLDAKVVNGRWVVYLPSSTHDELVDELRGRILDLQQTNDRLISDVADARAERDRANDDARRLIDAAIEAGHSRAIADQNVRDWRNIFRRR